MKKTKGNRKRRGKTFTDRALIERQLRGGK